MDKFTGWVLVVLGWVVVHLLTRDREIRRQNAELALGLVERASEIESYVIAYHVGANRDFIAEPKIVSAFNELASDIELVGCRSRAVSAGFIEFKKKSMMNNFMTNGFKSCSEGDGVVMGVVDSALDFRIALKRDISSSHFSPSMLESARCWVKKQFFYESC